MTDPSSRALRAPKPLPFDPKKLDGLSERPIVSHYENGYGGVAWEKDFRMTGMSLAGGSGLVMLCIGL